MQLRPPEQALGNSIDAAYESSSKAAPNAGRPQRSKIGARFGVKTLMLEGGGRINGGMLAAGLIDEVSVLVAPAVDGRVGTRLGRRGSGAMPLALEYVEQRADDVLWLRYRVEPWARGE